MIIDCHTHINFVSGGIEASSLLEASENVDKCIILATASGPTQQVNSELSEFVKSHSSKMIGFAFIDPTIDPISVDHLTSIKEKLDLKGFVVYCSNCGFHPANTRAMRFYEIAQQLKMPVYFHNSGVLEWHAVLDYAQPYMLDEIARQFPDLKIIIGALGLPFMQQTFSLLAKHNNVYSDLAIKPSNVWQLYNAVMAAHESSVIDKLLFGSGFPTNKADDCIEALLGFNKLMTNTNLPTIPRGSMKNIVERESLELLGIDN